MGRPRKSELEKALHREERRKQERVTLGKKNWKKWKSIRERLYVTQPDFVEHLLDVHERRCDQCYRSNEERMVAPHVTPMVRMKPCKTDEVDRFILFRELDRDSIVLAINHPFIKQSNDKSVLDIVAGMETATYSKSSSLTCYCHSTVSGNMNGHYELWKKNKYLDAVLTVNRHSVALHRTLLLGASPMLCEEFGDEAMQEMNEYRIEIDGTTFNESTVVGLVRYLYTGAVVCNSLQLHALHKLATLLRIKKLTEICDIFMTVNRGKRKQPEAESVEAGTQEDVLMTELEDTMSSVVDNLDDPNPCLDADPVDPV